MHKMQMFKKLVKIFNNCSIKNQDQAITQWMIIDKKEVALLYKNTIILKEKEV